MKKTKKEQIKNWRVRLDIVEDARKKALENQKIIQNFLNDFINSPNMKIMQEAFGKISEFQRIMSKIDYEFLKPKDKIKMYYVPSLETRMEYLIKKIFKENLDKHFNNAKIKSEIKKKIAHCRFCGAPVMRVADMSHFIDASTKCTNPKCRLVIRIPQDLIFEDITK